jgi:hypothetical protein
VTTRIAALALAFGLAASSAAGQTSARLPGELARLHGGLIDSLVAVIGHEPAAIRRGAGSTLEQGNMRRDKRGGIVLTVMVTDRHAVLHEFGHFLNAVRPVVFYEWADSLHPGWSLNDRNQREAQEAFAEDFAAAFTAWQNGWTPMSPGAQWLRAWLSRPAAEATAGQ